MSAPDSAQASTPSPERGALRRFLRFVEWLGNLLPHPVTLFALICVAVLLLSGVAGYLEWSVVDPRPEGARGRSPDGIIRAVSLLNAAGLRRVAMGLVTNFTSFAPLGTVLVALLGVGVAEKSGLLGAGIRALAVLSEEREPSIPNLPTAKEQGVNAIHGLMQFWWAPKGTPPERLAYLEKLLRQTMATKTVQERLSDLHIDPVFQVGEPLRETIRQRSANLQEITIENKTPLPPLQWLVLGIVIVCSILVWREGKKA